jgi:GGDEF domain-containing protein
MKLGRFQEFVRHVRDDETVIASTSSVGIYRRFDGIWYDDQDLQPTDERLLSALEQTLMKDQAWRRPKEYRAYFPLNVMQTVVVAHFSSKPTRVTRDKILSILLEADRRPKNAYDATHDSLTELFNRSAFENSLLRLLRSCALDGGTPSEEIEGVEPAKSLLLMSIDIDYFKQIK